METKFWIGDKEFVCTHDEKTRVFLTYEQDGEIGYYTFTCDFGTARMPEKIALKCETQAQNVYCEWNPAKKDHHITFHQNEHFHARLACWSPVMQTISKDGKNCSVLAVQDVKTPIACHMRIDIYQEKLERELVFFDAITNPMTHYETRIRVDNRPIPFYEALSNVADWYVSLRPTQAPAPAKAYAPMYSTWYSYLQNISADALVKECKEAKKYGMDTVILDDGWQTDNPNVIYGYTGDWKPTPAKFPNMRATVDEIHALGMDVIVWFSVPFVGYFSQNHKRFEGKYLTSIDGINASVLDPRYKDVRDFLIQTYVNALKEWNLDGLKLDFIDRFVSNGEVKPEMDYTSVEDATERLLLDVTAALKAVKEDVLIEFRQPYMGPVITECGNMVRVWDCPLDPLYNRIDSLNLRLTTKNCAVHADMINWAQDDTPENVGVRLFGSIFSVPQISVRFAEITDEQKSALKNYLDCYNANKDVLMHGKLSLSDPDSHYSKAQAMLDGKTVAVGFSKNVFDLASCTQAVLINLTSEKELILKNADGFAYAVVDCMGKTIAQGSVNGNLAAIPVPLAARVELAKASLGRKEDMTDVIGKEVEVVVDRPLGSYHPKHRDLYYPINYGYVEGVIGGDGEEQDAYVLGIDEPVSSCKGTVVAVVHRFDDVEEKWVVSCSDRSYTKQEIEDQIRFQEQYFRHEIRT